jgi:hypothetical protein
VKKTTKKLQLTRVTVQQLASASGAGWRRIGSYDSGCSGSCNTCIANEASDCNCAGYLSGDGCVLVSYAVPR